MHECPQPNLTNVAAATASAAAACRGRLHKGLYCHPSSRQLADQMATLSCAPHVTGFLTSEKFPAAGQWRMGGHDWADESCRGQCLLPGRLASNMRKTLSCAILILDIRYLYYVNQIPMIPHFKHYVWGCSYIFWSVVIHKLEIESFLDITEVY